MRARILAETPSEAEIEKLAQFRQVVAKAFDKFFVMGNPPDYEPGPEKSVAAIAAREGRTPRKSPTTIFWKTASIFISRWSITSPATTSRSARCSTIRRCLLGLSDGGAHCTSIVDSGVPTYMLTHWSRDRSRGPKLPIEMLVKRQTSETADFFGLGDRGRLAPGLRADVNLIDYDRLQVQKPDPAARHAGQRPPLRAKGRRLRDDARRRHADLRDAVEHTGALPGRLVRAGRDAQVLHAAE